MHAPRSSLRTSGVLVDREMVESGVTGLGNDMKAWQTQHGRFGEMWEIPHDVHDNGNMYDTHDSSFALPPTTAHMVLTCDTASSPERARSKTAQIMAVS